MSHDVVNIWRCVKIWVWIGPRWSKAYGLVWITCVSVWIGGSACGFRVWIGLYVLTRSHICLWSSMNANLPLYLLSIVVGPWSCPTPHHSPVEPKIPHLKGELSGDSVQKPWHICAPWPVPLRWFQRFGSEGRLSGERIPYQLTGELRGWTVSNLSIPEWTLGEETTLKKLFIACLVLQTGK